MDLLPSPEQAEIVDSSAAFLRDRLPITRTRALLSTPSNVDRDAWAAAAELGWFALGLPEALGGVGCGLADEALLFREIGRSLACGPFISSVLGARVAAFAGQAELAEQIVAGRRVGLAIPDSLGALNNGVVSGGMLLVDVDTDDGSGLEDGSGLVLVADGESAALVELRQLDAVSSCPCYDDATRLLRATANDVAALVSVPSSIDAIERRGHVLSAAALTGITEATRDISAEHAKVRVQFDRPIGVNQAIKHPCADMAVRAQLALAQTLFAAIAQDEGRVDAEFHALSAHLVAGEAAEFASSWTIQILGGMGFTFEHDAHLYVKRTFVLTQLFGGTQPQLARLLALPEAI
jgi:alkylation response protein AidB-like acyl-CoA dehydrogenase